MARQTVRIEGLRDLEKALRELPKATGKNVLKRTLTTSTKPVEEDARRLAPKRTGELAKSITIGPKSRIVRRQRGDIGMTATVEMFVGAGALPHAHLLEFGTATQPPRRFLTPAWDANQEKVLGSIKSDLASEIEKARARLAKKAARAARR